MKSSWIKISYFIQFKKKKGLKGKKGVKGGRPASAYGYYYAGTAAETNRPRRRDMERLKERRDEYLEGKKDLLLLKLDDIWNFNLGIFQIIARRKNPRHRIDIFAENFDLDPD